MPAPSPSPRPAVTVVDYGVGNLFSVRRALEHCGADVCLTSDPGRVAASSRLVLPGVGAFADGMRGLRERGLVEPIRAYAARGGRFLGICLGMQMMLEVSEEFGEHEGLGIMPGRVVPVPATTADGRRHRVPHIGWGDLRRADPARGWQGTLLAAVPEGASVYFVHSFTAQPDREEHRLADCDYDGRRLAAVVGTGEVCGCQFHPEKSGETGLRIIRAFLGYGLDGPHAG
jgi:glutamine amidotransferase